MKRAALTDGQKRHQGRLHFRIAVRMEIKVRELLRRLLPDMNARTKAGLTFSTSCASDINLRMQRRREEMTGGSLLNKRGTCGEILPFIYVPLHTNHYATMKKDDIGHRAYPDLYEDQADQPTPAKGIRH